MVDIELDDTATSTSRKEQKMYSKVIGPKLLKRIKFELGEEVLVQFGYTKTVLQRMQRRGVMGGEIDKLSAILIAKDMFKLKYIKAWEWELFQKIYPIFVDYFYLKPCVLLALRQSTSHVYQGVKMDKLTYDQIFWGEKNKTLIRPLLDRTFIYDGMLYLILRLRYMYEKLGKNQIDEILFHDFGTVHHKQPTPQGIFYDHFMGTSIDSKQKLPRVVLAKDKNAYGVIKELYDAVRKAFSEQCIGNIEDYLVTQSGPKYVEHQNHVLVNFALHYKFKVNGTPIPNIFLADLNAICSRLQEKRV